ncbi:hypothetical protein ABZ351_20230 [Streptomyces microflavus]|uniref:hypothetical protein n=1 Tax=Streptomyces microflavus TaxID=1919 RepID=UPI0033E7A6DB
MDAGLAAIGGALAGAIAAVGGAMIHARSQRATTRDNIRAEYQKETREARRNAYASLHSAAKTLALIAGSDGIWSDAEGLRDAWQEEDRLEVAWDEIGFLGPVNVISAAENVRHYALDALRGLRALWSFHQESPSRRSVAQEEQHANALSQQLDLASTALMQAVEEFREEAGKALGDVGLG